MSETFFYQPLSEINIQSISKEEAAELLSKKGGKYKKYDIEFLETLYPENYLESSSFKRYYHTLKNNIKKMSKKDKTKSNRQLYQGLRV